MIIDKMVEIGLCPNNIKYFEDKGYQIPRHIDSKGRSTVKKGSKITVKVEDLMISSRVKVRCQCEGCQEIRSVYYYTIIYRKNSLYKVDGTTLCQKCRAKTLRGKNSGAYKHGNVRFSEYRNNARRRDIEFNLSADEFNKIMSEECHYCGGSSKDYTKNSRGNGIDRKDSKVGYQIENCVSCCSRCNFAKGVMNYEEFASYIKRIYERIVERESKE